MNAIGNTNGKGRKHIEATIKSEASLNGKLNMSGRPSRELIVKGASVVKQA